MRDLKTYLSVAPVVSTLWFGSLAGLLIEINRLFPDALIFPFFSFQLLEMRRGEEDQRYNQLFVTNPSPSLFFFFHQNKLEIDKNKSGFTPRETKNSCPGQNSIHNKVRGEMGWPWQQYHTRYLNEK